MKRQQRAFAIRNKAFGPDHLLVAESLDELARLYTNDHRDDTGPAYRRAAEIRERALGPDHPDVATSLENCAFYNAEPYHESTEKLLERALMIRKNAFGLKHPTVARSMELLARHFFRGADAEKLLQDALAIREEIQGRDHPDVSAALVFLAELYVRAARYKEAAGLFIRSIDILVHALAIDQPTWHESREIIEVAQDASGGDFGIFERVSVSEDAAYRMILPTRSTQIDQCPGLGQVR